MSSSHEAQQQNTHNGIRDEILKQLHYEKSGVLTDTYLRNYMVFTDDSGCFTADMKKPNVGSVRSTLLQMLEREKPPLIKKEQRLLDGGKRQIIYRLTDHGQIEVSRMFPSISDDDPSQKKIDMSELATAIDAVLNKQRTANQAKRALKTLSTELQSKTHSSLTVRDVHLAIGKIFREETDGVHFTRVVFRRLLNEFNQGKVR